MAIVVVVVVVVGGGGGGGVVVMQYTAKKLHRTKILYLSPNAPYKHQTSTVQAPYRTVIFGAFVITSK